jgi:hypothetical protein
VRYFPAVLRRRLIFLLLVWTVAWPASATAPASGSTTVSFAVTVEGTQRTVITAVRRSVDDLGCSVTRAHDDRRTLSFATREPGRLAVSVPGGAASARVDVTVRASGTKRQTRSIAGEAPECDLAPQTSEAACGPVSLPGVAIVRLPAPGGVALAGSLARSRDAARCAPSAGRAQPFLVGSRGQFPAGLLTDRSVARIILRGDARFTDTLASGGRRVTTVRWTVVLRRLS